MSRVKRSKSDGKVQLSKHFYLHDFLVGPAPAPSIHKNVFRQAEMMEKVQDLLAKPVTIFSGYTSDGAARSCGYPEDSPLRYAGACAFNAPRFGDAPTILEHLVICGIARERMSIHGIAVVLELES